MNSIPFWHMEPIVEFNRDLNFIDAVIAASRASDNRSLEFMSSKFVEMGLRTNSNDLVIKGELTSFFVIRDIAGKFEKFDKNGKPKSIKDTAIMAAAKTAEYDDCTFTWREFLRRLNAELGAKSVSALNLFTDLDPQTKLISLGGLTMMMMRSNLPGARSFARWLCFDVMQSIANSGRYVLQDESDKLIAKHKLELQKAKNENTDLHRFINSLIMTEDELESRLENVDGNVERVLSLMPSENFVHVEFVPALKTVLLMGNKKVNFTPVKKLGDKVTTVVEFYCHEEYLIEETFIPHVGRSARMFIANVSSSAIDLSKIHDNIRDNLLVTAFKCIYAKGLAPTKSMPKRRHQAIVEALTTEKDAQIEFLRGELNL